MGPETSMVRRYRFRHWQWPLTATVVTLLFIVAPSPRALGQQEGACGDVPALSSWNLVAVLLVLVAGGIALQRRKRLAAEDGFSSFEAAGFLFALAGIVIVVISAVAQAQGAGGGACCPSPTPTPTATPSPTPTASPSPLPDILRLSLRGNYEDSQALDLDPRQPPKQITRRLWGIEGFVALRDSSGSTSSGSITFWNNGEINLSGESSSARSSFELQDPAPFSLRHPISEELLSGTVQSGKLGGIGVTACGLFNISVGDKTMPVDATTRWIADPTDLRKGAFMLEFSFRF